LGTGQWGEVRGALKDGLQRVAVKSLRLGHGELRDAHSQRDSFAQEIAMMQYLSRDANIVQFFGACVVDGRMMLVTELMEGGDLRSALSSDVAGNLGWYRLGKGLALDIARGLHFLHEHNVVHRDIKSKNVLLTRDGCAKLGDVGLAHFVAEDGMRHVKKAAEDEEQQQGRPYTAVLTTAAGTFAWMAPELVLGDVAISTKADIYSFGVVLLEIITHEMPMRGAIRMPRVPEECPQGVVDAVEACMQVDPEKRPTARQVHDILLACPPSNWAHGGSSNHTSVLQGMLRETDDHRGSPPAQGHATTTQMGDRYIWGLEAVENGGTSRSATQGSVTPPLAEGQHGSSSTTFRALEFINPKLRRVVHEVQQTLYGARGRGM